MFRKSIIIILAFCIVSSCSDSEVIKEKKTISGQIILPLSIQNQPQINVMLFHAISGIGFQEHPLYEIETFQTDQSTFEHTFDYDPKGNQGLLVYAWVDLDGDNILCTPSSRNDLAGAAVNEEFPETNKPFLVQIDTPCVGPDWFYPTAK
ncbi:MAG: hypothetical protein V1257_10810 [Candidatus Neomarinimicrobiota bacterium]|jgi:hypothetical protein|nr:hypothetical protein [Candidatus Neomarinimicrobiota bacterium]|tara:strand:- start:1368 stop:1817 length:450 start_codon:yes stop_codon:yes gene_type:complete